LTRDKYTGQLNFWKDIAQTMPIQPLSNFHILLDSFANEG